MIRVGFVIGGYPPEEHKRRADVALSYSTAEIQVGIVDVAASPYFYGMTPTEIQLVAPAFIESFRRAEKEGYDAVVPLCTLDLGVDGGNTINDAMLSALDLRPRDEGRTFTVVFFTDGQPTIGETNIDKITFPAVYGLADSRRMAEQECARAHAVLEPFGGRAVRLHELADVIVHRKS